MSAAAAAVLIRLLWMLIIILGAASVSLPSSCYMLELSGLVLALSVHTEAVMAAALASTLVPEALFLPCLELWLVFWALPLPLCLHTGEMWHVCPQKLHTASLCLHSLWSCFFMQHMHNFCWVIWLCHSPKLSVFTAFTCVCAFLLAHTALAVVLARSIPFSADFFAEIDTSSTSHCSASSTSHCSASSTSHCSASSTSHCSASSSILDRVRCFSLQK